MRDQGYSFREIHSLEERMSKRKAPVADVTVVISAKKARLSESSVAKSQLRSFTNLVNHVKRAREFVVGDENTIPTAKRFKEVNFQKERIRSSPWPLKEAIDLPYSPIGLIPPSSDQSFPRYLKLTESIQRQPRRYGVLNRFASSFGGTEDLVQSEFISNFRKVIFCFFLDWIFKHWLNCLRIHLHDWSCFRHEFQSSPCASKGMTTNVRENFGSDSCMYLGINEGRGEALFFATRSVAKRCCMFNPGLLGQLLSHIACLALMPIHCHQPTSDFSNQVPDFIAWDFSYSGMTPVLDKISSSNEHWQLYFRQQCNRHLLPWVPNIPSLPYSPRTYREKKLSYARLALYPYKPFIQPFLVLSIALFYHISTLEHPVPTMEGSDFTDMADNGHKIPPLKRPSRLPINNAPHTITDLDDGEDQTVLCPYPNISSQIHSQVAQALRAASCPVSPFWSLWRGMNHGEDQGSWIWDCWKDNYTSLAPLWGYLCRSARDGLRDSYDEIMFDWMIQAKGYQFRDETFENVCLFWLVGRVGWLMPSYVQDCVLCLLFLSLTSGDGRRQRVFEMGSSSGRARPRKGVFRSITDWVQNGGVAVNNSCLSSSSERSSATSSSSSLPSYNQAGSALRQPRQDI